MIPNGILDPEFCVIAFRQFCLFVYYNYLMEIFSRDLSEISMGNKD